MFGFRKRHNESTYRIFHKAFKYFQRTQSNDDRLTEDENFFVNLLLFVTIGGEQIVSNWHDFMHDDKTIAYCVQNAYEDAGYTADEFVFYQQKFSPMIKNSLQSI